MAEGFSSRRIIELTDELVRINSVVGTQGERELGEHLHALLERECGGMAGVSLQRIETDYGHRPPALMAFWRSPANTKRTIVLMGHYDVVGLEPYGSLADRALDSDALRKAYAAGGDPELQSAAADPEWVFGRGWLDMKSGIAVIIELFRTLASENELPLNLVLLITPDEESQSRGLYAALPELNRLRREQGLELVQIVNADYMSPLFEGDERRFIYSGTIGKFTLGLTVLGTTTHAGSPFGGVNAASLAGYLAFAVEHDRKFLQGHRGEWLPPPTVLHLADRRRRYDVMTVESASLYANVFNIAADSTRLWRDTLQEIRRLVRRYDSEMRKRYNRFVARADINPQRDARRPEVIDFATLLERSAANMQREPQDLLAEARAAASHEDERQRGIEVVNWLGACLPQGRAMVVASLLHPWYPCRIENDPERLATMRRLCEEQGLVHFHIYPYISDMSAFAWQGGVPELLGSCSPLDQQPDDIEMLEQLACPVLNLGPWGMGAHTGQERSRLDWLSTGLPEAMLSLIRMISQSH
ncbi:M20/M25/M40 family metallo-hydrolase [bacterium]|nr:M20/M25/M40 family metallo-hydrolase [bacterium]